MNTTRILNQAQAEAVYSAMCHLNNVSALARTIEMQDRNRHTIQVHERSDGAVIVTLNTGGIVLDSNIERYSNQSAFAAAYGLDEKEPRTAVYTAGIGWQVATASGRRGNFDTEAQALAADPNALIETL